MTIKAKNLFRDTSLLLLIISNLITIYIAVRENWDLSTVMWVYWVQSIVIGIFNFVRIYQLKEFSTENFTINGQPVTSTDEARNFVALFFAAHYGLFHFVYLFFLIIGPFSSRYGYSGNPTDFKYVVLASLVFFFNHLYSYLHNKPVDNKKQNIGAIMFYPYARILPMHFAFFLGATAGIAVPIFLSIKTLADCIMHIYEHYVLRRSETPVESL
jgi:hypothetical protein